MGEEVLGVYEMRYRQLMNDVGEGGLFGYMFYSQTNSKLSLVGTLARVKRIDRLDDGGLYVSMEGAGRFFLKEVKGEKPYLRAKVQVFSDYSEDEEKMKSQEILLLNEIRYSLKLMSAIYPQNNYTITDKILRNRPLVSPALPLSTTSFFSNTSSLSVRSISLPQEKPELVRSSHLSFAAMEMLKTDSMMKQVFLQEPVVEKRYVHMIKVLEESTAFLEGEMIKKGLVDNEGVGLSDLRQQFLSDVSDLEVVGTVKDSSSSWIPENFVDGDWNMQPTLMD
jgi:ATP-dependent Lon protease